MNRGAGTGLQSPSPYPPGIIWEYAGLVLPDPSRFGVWLWANGLLVARSQYPDLFQVCGFSYSPTPGTDPGGGMFYLPDRRGKVGVGYSPGETEFNTLGKTGGSKDAAVATHNHGVAAATGVSGARDINHDHGDDHLHGDDHRHGDDHHHGETGTIHAHPVGGSWGNVVGFRTDGAANGLVSGGLERLTYTTVSNHGQHWHDWKNNAGYSTVTNWKNEQGYSTQTAWKGSTHGSWTTGWVNSYTTHPSHNHAVTIDNAGVSATSARLQPYTTVTHIIKV